MLHMIKTVKTVESLQLTVMLELLNYCLHSEYVISSNIIKASIYFTIPCLCEVYDMLLVFLTYSLYK